MNRCLPLLAAGLTLTAASMAYACPDPASGEAYYSHAERAYYLSDGKTYDVAIGGSTPWSSCGISGDGFLPEKASIRLDFNAAEGRSALVQVASGCGMTHMFVHAGDYRGTASGVVGTDPVSVVIPRANIGNDQTIMVYLSAGSAGEVCEGTITFASARG